MIIARSNYRVEVRFNHWPSKSTVPHDLMVSAGAEAATEISEKLGFDLADISLAWDTRYECENCGDGLELVGDEIECAHCERFMCYWCNSGHHDRPICEACWEEGAR